jgi:predicted transcriptional regulator
MTTLTLELDDALLARAAKLAAARKMSVSEMIERLVRVVAQPPLSKDQLPPLTRQAAGMLPLMSDEEVERALNEVRSEKYGRE